MPIKNLTAEEYTAGIRTLTLADLAQYGERIVSSTMAHALLEAKYGKLDRNIIIQKCRRDQLHPMGRYKEKLLYFWRSEIDNLQVEKSRRPKKAK